MNLCTFGELYSSSGRTGSLCLIFLRIMFVRSLRRAAGSLFLMRGNYVFPHPFLLRLFRPIIAPALPPRINAGCVQNTAHNRVIDADVFHAPAANQDHRVFLKLVSLARNIRGDFHPVRKPDTGDFSHRRVRLPWIRRCNLDAYAALKRRTVFPRPIFKRIKTASHDNGARPFYRLFPSFLYKLAYR